MDIRKSLSDKVSVDNDLVSLNSVTKFKTGIISTADAKLMLPPAIQTKLTALGSKYGIPFDLGNIGFDGKMAENVKALRTIADMATAESKLLPEMMKLIRQLMRAEIKLAQFHKLTTKAAIKHQEKLDKQTADIFLAMAGYQAKSTKLEHRTNVRNQLKEKRSQAYSNYYQNSVYGAESQIIDTEFELLESNRKILTESKVKRVEFNSKRKEAIQTYVNSAFTD
jgi:hypothetical protein